MILKITMKTEKVPLSYNVMGTSIIKESLKACSEEYFNKLYSYNGKSNKASKNFSASMFIKDYEIQGEEFIVNGQVIIYISTPDYEFGLHLYNGIMNKKKYKYKEYELEKIRVDIVKEKKILTDEAVFHTMSPMCIKNKQGRFLDVDDESYEVELNYIADVILRNYRGYGLKRNLEFKNINMKKIVVKEEIRDFKKITNKKYQYVNSYKGRFLLRGDNEDLNDIYKLGLGMKRGQFFGNLDVLTKEVM